MNQGNDKRVVIASSLRPVAAVVFPSILSVDRTLPPDFYTLD
jgi:hypothetical protein